MTMMSFTQWVSARDKARERKKWKEDACLMLRIYGKWDDTVKAGGWLENEFVSEWEQR